jgi:hypothetical protein
MTVAEAKVDFGADHNMPGIAVVCIPSLKVLLDKGTRGTSIWTKILHQFPPSLPNGSDWTLSNTGLIIRSTSSVLTLDTEATLSGNSTQYAMQI